MSIIVKPSTTTARSHRLPVVAGSAGDHPAVFQLLTAIFGAPSANEFHASLDDPFYEPRDRLLIKLSGQIIAHAQIVHRTMQLGPLRLPVGGLDWLGTLAEHRSRGHGSRLLQYAERQMIQSGAALGVLRTSDPQWFRRFGWVAFAKPCFSRADARRVLAHLLDRGFCHRPHLKIRPWRRWELAPLARVYHEGHLGAYGILERNEAYWQWLNRRGAFDQIYVALDGPDQLDLREATTRLVGYAAVKGEQVVELVHAPNWNRASIELLIRACSDAIEHDRQTVLLHASPWSPLHRLLQGAGGFAYPCRMRQGEVSMAKVLDPLKLLRSLCDEFHRRSVEANLPLPYQLGMQVDDKRYRLEIGCQGANVVSRHVDTTAVRVNIADLTRLLLGRFNWDRAAAQGRLAAWRSAEIESVRVLFPRLRLWRPPLDDLRA